ncbi:MAG TPA: tetratricopeptide repeat-containing protein [Chthonomonadaceae bacterium]|nr:tetratricopeptide repeat-containing protein [Chthonomonadaceae bacterium]
MQSNLDDSAQAKWAECTVRVINHAFPEPSFPNWHKCAQLLSHTQVCVEHIRRWGINCTEAKSLIEKANLYLRQRAHFQEAEPLVGHLLERVQVHAGSQFEELATRFQHLTELYNNQGEYQQAEPLIKRILEDLQRNYGPEPPEVIGNILNGAEIYWNQSRHTNVEAYSRPMSNIIRRALSPNYPPSVAMVAIHALLLRIQGQIIEAEPMYGRVIEMLKATLGEEHIYVADSIIDLAEVYYDQEMYGAAESLYIQGLAISEQARGINYASHALWRNDLAELYFNQGRYEEAESHYRQAEEVARSVQLDAEAKRV